MASGLDKALEEFRLKVNQQQNTLRTALQPQTQLMAQGAATYGGNRVQESVTQTSGAGPAVPSNKASDVAKPYPQLYKSDYTRPDMSDSRYKSSRGRSMLAGFEIGQEVSEKSNNEFFKLGATMGAGIAGLFRPDLAGQMRYKKDMDMYNNMLKEEQMRTAADQTIEMNRLKIEEAQAEAARQKSFQTFDADVEDAQKSNASLPDALATIRKSARGLIKPGAAGPDALATAMETDKLVAAVKKAIVAQGGIVSAQTEELIRNNIKTISNVTKNDNGIQILDSNNSSILTLTGSDNNIGTVRTFESTYQNPEYVYSLIHGKDSYNKLNQEQKDAFGKKVQETVSIIASQKELSAGTSENKINLMYLFLKAQDASGDQGIINYNGGTFTVGGLKAAFAKSQADINQNLEQVRVNEFLKQNPKYTMSAVEVENDIKNRTGENNKKGEPLSKEQKDFKKLTKEQQEAEVRKSEIFYALDYSKPDTLLPVTDPTGKAQDDVPNQPGFSKSKYRLDLNKAEDKSQLPSGVRDGKWDSVQDYLKELKKVPKQLSGLVPGYKKEAGYSFRRDNGKIYVYERQDWASDSESPWFGATIVYVFKGDGDLYPERYLYGPNIGPKSNK